MHPLKFNILVGGGLYVLVADKVQLPPGTQPKRVGTLYNQLYRLVCTVLAKQAKRFIYHKVFVQTCFRPFVGKLALCNNPVGNNPIAKKSVII